MAKKTDSHHSFLILIFITVGLFIVALVADILDIIFYIRFANANGFAWFQPLPWALMWKYLSTWPGNFLTILGFAPYLVVWAGCQFLLRNRKSDDGESDDP